MSIILYQVFIQGIGVLGVIAGILSFQCGKHKKLIALKTANELLFAVQYAFLGAYTGMMMNAIGCIRNLVFLKAVEKNKSTVFARIVFSAVFFIFIILTWSGFKSILIGAAKILSTVAYGSSNTFFIRGMVFITSIAWFIYNFIVKSYAGCLCEFLTICSVIIGVIRVDIPKIINKRRVGI